MLQNEKQDRFQLTSFALHIIAMALMLCDHIWGTYLLPYNWLTAVGRIAYPIFAFMLVEGFVHTGNRRRYLLRLVLWAVITEIPFNLVMGSAWLYPLHQNVLWTFTLAFLMMLLLEKVGKLRRLAVKILLYLLVVVLFYLLGLLTFVDYYGYGLLIVALFYFTRPLMGQKGWKKIVGMAAQVVALWWISSQLMKGYVITLELLGVELELYRQSLMVLALPLIWLYRGRQGPYNKGIRLFYYAFYPGHLLVLLGIIALLG